MCIELYRIIDQVSHITTIFIRNYHFNYRDKRMGEILMFVKKISIEA